MTLHASPAAVTFPFRPKRLDSESQPASGRFVPARLRPEQFAERYSRGARVYWAIACGVLGQRSHAEDVLQEAAVVALEKLEQFDADTNFEAWMGRIVRFTALNAMRARRRTRNREQAQAGLDDFASQSAPSAAQPEVPDPAAARSALTGFALQDELGDELSNALHGLSSTARTCLLLRALCELSFREIADLLGIPEGTAMSHVSRARAQMRAALRPRAQAPSPREGSGSARWLRGPT